MAFLFRKLRNKRYWDGRDWLQPKDVQVDALKCLLTENNQLSVYLLDDPDAQLDRTIAALALTRDHVSIFDLALAPSETLSNCDIELIETTGDTPDGAVNTWHRELVNLTSIKVAKLSEAIRTGGDIERYNPTKVERVIATAVSSHYVDVSRIKQSMSASLRTKGII